jgi:hypothetical protein
MKQTTSYATELFDVIALSWEGEHTLRLQFDDGSERVIDFAPILHGPVWGSLRDVERFKQVRLDREIGTLVWPGGLDIDPTVLHDWPEHLDHIVEKRRKQAPVMTAAPT